MKDDFEDMEVCSTEMGQDEARNKQISELVKTINEINSMCKELLQLVIDQGSIIDRIDFNIEETFNHIDRGVEHLKSADEKA